MKLSIVIVNYNVKHFLEQCLNSVFLALENIESEVFVVDNNSVDGSMEMVKEKFPQAIRIINKENVGFSKANNQAILKAQGEYVLLLNPDTVVEEETFSKCLQFMDAHPDAGALGIKMMDGKGNYLPESKRGLPTPWVAFYKIFGLSSIFPNSKKFARYYMGHLDKNFNHEVEILAGAFMLMRKTTLDETGLLDETFFMYGEDIDLSYRITQSGYKNYYFADSSIIHYKGESTKKGSLNYVYVFYKAMIIFAEKHFSQSYAKFFRFFILMAIYLRAGLSLIKRFVSALALPLLDSGILILGLYYIKEYWEHNHRFVVGGEYSLELIRVAFPLYALGWIAGIFLNGGYEKPAKISQVIKGVFVGSIAILVAYSLLSEEFRFSRAILLLGAVWASFSIPLVRFAIQKITGQKLLVSSDSSKRVLIVGLEDEAQRVEQLIKQANNSISYVAFVNPPEKNIEGENYTGKFEQISDMITVFDITEVVFCARDVSSNFILNKMTELNSKKVEIKIAPSESHFVIGSNSIDTQGSWYSVQFNDISKPSNKRAKLFFDLSIAIFLLISLPFSIWFVKNKIQFIRNLFSVLSFQKTWIAYDSSIAISHLPKLKPSILKTTEQLKMTESDEIAKNHLNQLYAKEYKVFNDLNFLLENFSRLGNSN